MKMFKLKCVQDLDLYKDAFFKHGETYIGRISKSGAIMIKDSFDRWHVLDDRKQMHVYNLSFFLRYYFEIEEEFYVKTHKEAIRYK